MTDGAPSTASTGEIAGGVVIAVAVLLLLVSAFAYGAGTEIAFFPLLTAFALGVTGLGIHLAFREARFRRDGR